MGHSSSAHVLSEGVAVYNLLCMGVHVAWIVSLGDHMYALETSNGAEWSWVRRGCHGPGLYR